MAFGLSFGSSDKTSTTKSNSQTDPWDVTIPYLTDFLKQVGGANSYGLSPDQAAGFSALKANAAEGNPWTSQIAGLADQAFATPDRTGAVGDAYNAFKGQLGDVASGKFLDVLNNPQLKALLDQVGTEAFNRQNALFAGAGRDLSGANSQAAAKGVALAQTPLLLDQFNKQQQLQMDAAQRLYDGGRGTATTQADLDAARLNLQKQGVDLGKTAIGARDYAANQTINLDQQIKQLPLQDLGLLASILFPAAGLGAQEQGTSKTNSNTSSSGFSFGISDVRVKRNILLLGTMANGLPIYRWRYLWGPHFRIGPMAQDVRRMFPRAVITLPSGILAINFDALAQGA